MADVRKRSARVLLVDDSPTIRRVVSQVLRQAGHDVTTAEDGESGLAEVRALSPDLILLDFVMPGMNGIQFIKQLDLEDLGQAPIILMSTRTDPVPDGVLKNLGVVDSITKPFSPDAVLALVSYCLDKHGMQKRVATTHVTKFDYPEEAPFASTEQDRDRADHALQDIARLLADALVCRNVANADALATSVCADLRASLATQRLGDVLRTPQPSLSGDLAGVPLPEVLQLLKFQGQTGVLDVALDGLTANGPPARFEVAVKSGAVIAVRARDARADLLLGNYFLGEGVVSRTQLDAILQERSTTPIGQRLVEAGLITTEQLRRCVGAQAQDLVVELLRARRGFFALRRGDDVLPATHISPGFSVDMLLLESLRRIDEWSVIEKLVPSFGAAFARLGGHMGDVDDLAPDEIEVLSLFRGGQTLTVHDVLRVSSLRAFDVCKLLYRLSMLRRLRRVHDGGTSSLLDDAPIVSERLDEPGRP